MLSIRTALAVAAIVLPAAFAVGQSVPAPNAAAPQAAPLAADSAAKAIFYASQQDSHDWLASDFLNHSVYGPKDEKLGKITDIIIDGEGEAAAVIIGVGGFLGIGEKDVAVSFKALTPKVKNGTRYLTLDVTKDTLKSAPKFTKLAHQM